VHQTEHAIDVEPEPKVSAEEIVGISCDRVLLGHPLRRRKKQLKDVTAGVNVNAKRNSIPRPFRPTAYHGDVFTNQGKSITECPATANPCGIAIVLSPNYTIIDAGLHQDGVKVRHHGRDLKGKSM